MADERRQTRIDPLVEGVTDGVSHGYQALERVLEGLAQSLRVQGRGGAAGSGVTPAGRPSAVDHSTQIVIELLHRAGDLAHGVAHTVARQAPGGAAQQAGAHEVVLKAAPGERSSADFKVWNTGPTLLRELTLHASDLHGEGRQIPSTAVTFTPPAVHNVRQSAAAEVQVEVAVPSGAVAGRYRGLIEASPGDTYAVLALTVVEGGPHRATAGRAKSSKKPPASKGGSKGRKA
jgi:hypothetical protein